MKSLCLALRGYRFSLQAVSAVPSVTTENPQQGVAPVASAVQLASAALLDVQSLADQVAYYDQNSAQPVNSASYFPNGAMVVEVSLTSNCYAKFHFPEWQCRSAVRARRPACDA